MMRSHLADSGQQCKRVNWSCDPDPARVSLAGSCHTWSPGPVRSYRAAALSPSSRAATPASV